MQDRPTGRVRVPEGGRKPLVKKPKLREKLHSAIANERIEVSGIMIAAKAR
ncbi:MAG: hypothetical protein QNJ72_03190 [Pleurocapsa sp. MO_226.B13]|nr:hypothetical protein [Pleurocapsa sp. MO_226.B13]